MNEWLERHKTLILSIVGLLVAGSVGLLAVRWRPAAEIVIEPPQPTATPGPIRVHVDGAVAVPGVYSLSPDAIVQDALNAAGGPTADADLSQTNLALSLSDEERLYIPRIGELPTAAPPSTGGSTVGGLVNINTATAAELETLPGIGPVLAQRIVDYREANGPFPSVEAIQNVAGIGPAIFDQIKDLITV